MNDSQAFQSALNPAALRHSLARGTPFGDIHWQTKTAAILGLESSLRPSGRPKKQEK